MLDWLAQSLSILSPKTYVNFFRLFGENTILVPTFWDHGQFSPYILRAVNLVPAIFKSQSI